MDDFQSQPVSSPQQPEVPLVTPPPGAPVPPVLRRPKGSGKWSAIKEFYLSNKWYVWAISLGVIIIAVLAYFVLRPSKAAPTKEANVNVTIDAPQTAASGSEVIYKVKVENQDKASLVQLDLELVYPDGVNYVSSSPKPDNLSGTLFKVPDLTPGQNAVVIVKTAAQGNINDDKQIIARLHYHYSNFNSEFIKEATSSLRLVASDVNLELSGVQSTTNAQLVSYDINYTNNSDHDIPNTRIEVDYPDDFSFADSTPKPDLSKNIWNIGTMKQGQSGKISFQGTFKNAQPGQSQTFTANFLVLDDQGNYYTQGTNAFTTAISSLPLVATQAVDNNGGIAKPGDTLRYTVTYQNTAAVAATGVNIVLTIDPKSIDLSTIQAEGAEVNNNTITWNASSVSNLEDLNPNDSGTVHFTAKIKNPAVKDSSKNVAINTTVKIKSNEYSTYLPGNDLSVKVSSPSALSDSVKYVSGQLPLQVGKSTTVQVILSLTNSTDDFASAVLTGFIPSGVNYDPKSINSKESANVSYDAATGKLTWKLGVLSAHSGDFDPARTLTFNVQVSPSSSQVQQVVALFRTVAFSGKDTFTDQDINLQTNDITSSSIAGDPNGGRVGQ